MKKLGIFLAAVQLMTCLSFPAFAADNTDGKIHIEAEDFTGGASGMTVRANSEFSGSGYLGRNYVACDGDDHITSYDFEVEKSGTYVLTGRATERSQSWTTDWNVYIDEESNKPAAYTKTKDVATTVLTNCVKDYSMGKFKLKKGKHTLYLTLDGSDNVPTNGTIFLADYFDLKSTEGEDFALEKLGFSNTYGIFEENENVGLNFTFTTNAPEDVAYRFEIVDLYQRHVSDGTITIEKGKDESEVNLGTFKNGWYRLHVYENGSNTPIDGYYSFAVTVPLSRRTKFDDTAFAGDIGYGGKTNTDAWIDNWLHAGFSWVRGRGSGEHAGGGIELTKKLHQAGINMMDDVDPNAVLGSPNGTNKKTTDDLMTAYNTWKNTPAANGYCDEAYEVLNEMDLGNSVCADEWTAYFKAAAIGIYDGNPSTLKIHAGNAGYDSSYLTVQGMNDIMSYSDVWNYHTHSEYDSRVQFARMYANAYTDRDDVAVWGSEVGWPQYLPDPENSKYLGDDQLENEARGPIKTAVLQLANGSNKNFWFLATPYLENNKNFASVIPGTGLPYPSYSAVSTLTYVLGKGDIKGEIANMPSGATGYMFDDGNGNDAAVIWAEKQGYVTFEADEVTYFDMVGYSEVKKDEDGDGKISIYISPNPCFVKFNGRSAESNYYPMHFTGADVKPIEFTDKDRVVIQPKWPCADAAAAKENGYTLDKNSPFEMTLRVYNFNDKEMGGILHIINDDLVEFDETEFDLSIGAWGKIELTLTGTTTESADNGANGYVKYYITDENGEEYTRAVSKVCITNDGRTVEEGNYKTFDDIWDVNNWNLGNTGSTVKMSTEGNEEENVMTLTIDVPQYDWAFPWYKPENPSEMEGSQGIRYEVRGDVAKNWRLIGTYIHMKDGRQYAYAQGNWKPLNTEWTEVVIPWSMFYLYSSPLGAVDTREFAFEDIAGISVGAAPSAPVTYSVRNLGYFYSDNDADNIAKQPIVKYTGVESGQKFQNGDKIVITAHLPEGEYISYKVSNRNDKVEYSVDGNDITIDASDFGRGYHKVLISAEDRMNKQIMSAIDFYIE